MRAAALTTAVLATVVVATTLYELAMGRSGSPYMQFSAIGALAYGAASLWLRRRASTWVTRVATVTSGGSAWRSAAESTKALNGQPRCTRDRCAPSAMSRRGRRTVLGAMGDPVLRAIQLPPERTDPSGAPD